MPWPEALASRATTEPTYGEVALQGDPVLARILRGRLELLAEVPLQPVGEADGRVLRLVGGAQAVQHLRAGHAFRLPSQPTEAALHQVQLMRVSPVGTVQAGSLYG